MNIKKMSLVAVLVLCATGLHAMDEDTAAADAAAAGLHRRVGYQGVGVAPVDPVADALLRDQDPPVFLERLLERANRAGYYVRRREIYACLHALRENGQVRRGGDANESDCRNVAACGVVTAGAVAAFAYFVQAVVIPLTTTNTGSLYG